MKYLVVSRSATGKAMLSEILLAAGMYNTQGNIADSDFVFVDPSDVDKIISENPRIAFGIVYLPDSVGPEDRGFRRFEEKLENGPDAWGMNCVSVNKFGTGREGCYKAADFRYLANRFNFWGNIVRGLKKIERIEIAPFRIRGGMVDVPDRYLDEKDKGKEICISLDVFAKYVVKNDDLMNWVARIVLEY